MTPTLELILRNQLTILNTLYEIEIILGVDFRHSRDIVNQIEATHEHIKNLTALANINLNPTEPVE
jgi:hypothetical protein